MKSDASAKTHPSACELSKCEVLGGRSVARHFESPLEGWPRSLNIWALPHRGEGKLDSVDVVEVRGKILTGCMPV